MNTQPDTPTNSTRTVPEHHPNTPNTITNETIASEHADLGVKADTVRVRWFPWLAKVAPVELLKDGRGYTALAHELFGEYAQSVKREGMDPQEWVRQTKSRYAQEWGSAGVLDAELVPEEVGGTLALMHSQTSSLKTRLQAELESLADFNEHLEAIATNLTDAEIEAAQVKGALRGIQKFKVETTTELETYNRLQQDRLRREQQQ